MRKDQMINPVSRNIYLGKNMNTSTILEAGMEYPLIRLFLLYSIFFFFFLPSANANERQKNYHIHDSVNDDDKCVICLTYKRNGNYAFILGKHVLKAGMPEPSLTAIKNQCIEIATRMETTLGEKIKAHKNLSYSVVFENPPSTETPSTDIYLQKMYGSDIARRLVQHSTSFLSCRDVIDGLKYEQSTPLEYYIPLSEEEDRKHQDEVRGYNPKKQR